jgi:anti-sigma factor RsiW
MNTKQHYSEADLLETYYTQPGESMPVMLHLADCEPCAARYERIEKKIRGLGACAHDEKPETFWARQRISVMRRVQQPQTLRSSVARITRVAAAAVFALLLGGLVTWNRYDQAAPQQPVVRTATATSAAPAAPVKTTIDTTDPWQSEELKEFGSMVEWESWVDNGDQSL